MFPISIAFSPAIAAAIKPQTIIASQPYVLGPGETPLSVAQKYHLSVDELKKFNQFRTFSKPFEQSGVGDEIDIPLNIADFSAHDPASKPQDLTLGNVGGMSVFNPRPSGRNGIFTADGNNIGAPTPADQNRDAANAMLRSAATGEIGQKAQQWLNQFGTARVQLNVNDDFHLDGSAFDLLIPLYDKPNEMLFSQWGYRNQDSRNTINIGAGSRTWVGNWMYGVNAFYDEDITAHNRRFGMGLEAWRDYLKLSANNYFRLSDWRESRDLEDYNERPANGFDIRAEAYLPAYPQLGGKLIFEQYRGDNVALFGKDNLQNNPYAVTLGVNYTPISLVTLGVDYRQGKGDMNDTTFNLQMNYRLGASWQSQISPDSVAAMRTLAGTRYDLVDRNYNIVLQYQKQQVIELRLPDHLSGYESDPLTVTAEVTSKYALDRIDWDYAAITAAGGTITQSGQSALIIKLPPFQHAGAATNIYNLSAVAYDVKKNASNTAVSRIEVLPVAAQITAANLIATKNNAIANGSDYNQVQAKVTDAAGNPVAGQTVTFTATNGATVTTVIGTTGADGLAIATFTNLRAGTSVVTATLNGVSRSVDTNFNPDPTTAKVTLSVVRTGVVANGIASNEVSALVVDANGNPLSGQTVAFTATIGTVTAVINPTGADGIATATLTSLQAGSSTVTATLTNGDSQGKDVTFIADIATARLVLSVVNSGATADGINRNEVRAHVTDANGNNLAAQTVNFTVAAPALLFSATNPTDAGGIVTATFISKTPGTMAVTATLSNGSSQVEDIVFIPDTVTAKVELTVIRTGVVANGIATNEVSAHVTDALGNNLEGQSVTFTANNVDISPVTLLTGAGGTVSATFTSHVAGGSTVVATLTNSNNASENIEFIADVSTARVVLTVVRTGALANGIANNAVSALVEDASGNKLAGQTVTFTSTLGTVTSVINPTGTDGIATATIASLISGNGTVTATLANSANQAKPIDFIADVSTARITLTPVRTGAAANGFDTNEVSAHVTDANGNNLEGLTVTFTTTLGTITAVINPTNAGGIATATIVSLNSGDGTVTASLTNGANQAVAIDFIPDAATARVVLSVVRTDAAANNIATNEVSASVEDARGTKLDGQTVIFTATNGATVTPVINPTGPDGIATATLVSNNPGPSTVTATLANSQNSSVDVNFIPNAVIAGITLATNNATADGRETNSVRVLVHDAAGDPAPGVAVTLTSTTAGGTFHVVTSGATTGSDGSVIIEYTYTLANSIDVVATLTGTTQTATSSGGVFTIPSVQMTVLDYGTVSPPLPAIVDMTLISARGQPLPSTQLNVSIQEVASGGTAFIPFPAATASSPVTTNGAGQATLTGTSTLPTGANGLVFMLTAPGINEGMGGASNITDVSAQFFFF